MISSLWEFIRPWVPSTTALVGSIVVLVGVRLILARVRAERDTLPYRRQLATFALLLAGLFTAIILLPIDPEIRTQVLSVIGVLLSAVVALSSTSLVGNAMAGIMMRITKSYRPGDFVEVNGIVGRVTNQGLFHTEVQQITRDIVAVPNLYLSQHPVQVTRSSGSFVSIEISLGYELDTSEVDKALREAVENASLGEPFVLVSDLLDHAVVYRVFGLLEDVSKLLSARSRLRRSIVTTLHSRGIQIVSPSFVNRTEFPTDHEFIPDGVDSAQEDEQIETEDSEKVEAIAFDKAEEAESIERLYALQEELKEKLSELEAQMKEAKDEEKQRLRDARDQTKSRIERTAEIIERREEEAESNE